MPESLFNKVADLRPATLLKKRLWRTCFPVNFVNLFLQNISGGCFWSGLLKLSTSSKKRDTACAMS